MIRISCAPWFFFQEFRKKPAQGIQVNMICHFFNLKMSTLYMRNYLQSNDNCFFRPVSNVEWQVREVIDWQIEIRGLLSCWHLEKGSPVKPGAQLQIGLWFTTWQRALRPHVPGHGSTHFWLIHARFCGHSELTTHSGLQDGGLPMKPGEQEQTACWFTVRHWLFGPHGDGSQGFLGVSATTKLKQETNGNLHTCSTRTEKIYVYKQEQNSK